MIEFTLRLLGAVTLAVIVYDIYEEIERIERINDRRHAEFHRFYQGDFAHHGHEDDKLTSGINPVMP